MILVGTFGTAFPEVASTTSSFAVWVEVAVREAMTKAQELAAEKMKPLMGGLGSLGL